MKHQIVAAVLTIAVTAAAIPVDAHTYHHDSYHDYDHADDEAWGYLLVAMLVGAVSTSPIWGPMVLTHEKKTWNEPTRFRRYPYADGGNGFVSFQEGERPVVLLTDFSGTILDDEGQGRSLSAYLVSQSRLGLKFSQVSYEVDALDGARRGASSLHATYLFARNEQFMFSAGLGGRYNHHPIGGTQLSGVYRVDCFPVRPLHLMGSCEYDGDLHYRVGCSILYERIGLGIGIRSEVVDDTRHQSPEIYLGIQF